MTGFFTSNKNLAMSDQILQTPPVSTLDKLLAMGRWLEEKKGKDTLTLNLLGENLLSEGLIITGASSARHAQGLADFVLEKAGERNYEFLRMEGYKNGLWILLDFNDVIINILQQAERELYRLEELFPGRPLSLS